MSQASDPGQQSADRPLKDSPDRVLIVGAGPTGLTAAVELARRGLVAQVIDRREEASPHSRAVGILPRSLGLLAPSGVTNALLKAGVTMRAVHVYRGDHAAVTISLTNGHPRYDYALALAQDRTEAILRDAFESRGGSVRYGTALTNLDQCGDGVTAHLDDGTSAPFAYVLGADGVDSTTRNALGIPFDGFDLSETWSIADVDAQAWRHPECFTITVMPAGRVAVVAPLEAARYRVVTNTPDALATLPFPLDVTNVRRADDFRISIRQVARYGVDRVFLAGDAAHCHSPVGGRGMNLGIADAAEWAERLMTGTLDGYHASRHADGARTIAMSERARRFITRQSGLSSIVRSAAFRTVRILPALQRRVAREFLA